MTIQITLQIVAVVLVIAGVVIGWPPSMALAIAESANVLHRIDEHGAVRARNRGVLIFLAGVALSGLGVFLA